MAKQPDQVALLEKNPDEMYAVVTAANSRCPIVITGAAQNAMMNPR